MDFFQKRRRNGSENLLKPLSHVLEATHAGDSDVLKKGKREVEVIEPRRAAKQKEKVTPADVQTGENKYSKGYWINTVIATRLKIWSRNMSWFSWECILCAYVHTLSQKLKILRQCAFDWWFWLPGNQQASRSFHLSNSDCHFEETQLLLSDCYTVFTAAFALSLSLVKLV